MPSNPHDEDTTRERRPERTRTYERYIHQRIDRINANHKSLRSRSAVIICAF